MLQRSAFSFFSVAETHDQRLAGLLQRHRASGESQYADLQVADKVDSLIIVDRSVDWVTPMCTQLTYEGMLDEFIGIKNGQLPSTYFHSADVQLTLR